MTTVNSDTYTAQESEKIALDTGIFNAELRVVSATYTASSTASGTVINLLRLPKGTVIHALAVDVAALGASTTLKVGDGDDDDRYIAATSTASATTLRTGIGGRGYVIGTNTGDDLLTATVGGAAATGKIRFTAFVA